jgi:hypothetical protein
MPTCKWQRASSEAFNELLRGEDLEWPERHQLACSAHSSIRRDENVRCYASDAILLVVQVPFLPTLAIPKVPRSMCVDVRHIGRNKWVATKIGFDDAGWSIPIAQGLGDSGLECVRRLLNHCPTPYLKHVVHRGV